MIRIPLYMQLDLIEHHDDDLMEHDLRLMIPGASRAGIEARVISHFYQHPRVQQFHQRRLALSVPLTHRLLILAYEYLLAARDEEGAIGVSVSMSNASPWLMRSLDPHECGQIELELLEFIDPFEQVTDQISETIG